MNLDELIAKLPEVKLWRLIPGNPDAGKFPVVMLTASGSGEVDEVSVEFDTIAQRFEVQLREKP